MYCLAAIGLNVHFGYTGLLNFGQAGFMAVGGYAVASFVATWGLSFWLGMRRRAAAAGVLALLLGVPTLRLRADYLAIVTIAAAEIIRQTIGLGDAAEVLRRPGRPAGVHRRASPASTRSPAGSASPAWSPGGPTTSGCCWSAGSLVALCCLIVWLLMRSPWGRVLKASARTRTPSAASARTSTPTRCSR